MIKIRAKISKGHFIIKFIKGDAVRDKYMRDAILAVVLPFANDTILPVQESIAHGIVEIEVMGGNDSEHTQLLNLLKEQSFDVIGDSAPSEHGEEKDGEEDGYPKTRLFGGVRFEV